jgi:hypothetical protein
MTAKERLDILKEIKAQIEATELEREAVNENIKSSEFGVKRKEINSRLKKLEIALDDVISGSGTYDPNQMTIDEYIEQRENDVEVPE